MLPAWEGVQEGMRTSYRVWVGSGCFGARAITTAVGPDCCSVGTRQTQFRHELLHALGLPHNEWDPDSVMAPATPYNLQEARPMSASDIAMLRAVYERTFGL